MNKKSVKNLEISVTYSVGLSDVEIEEHVLNGLLSACDKGKTLNGESKNEEENYAFEWVLDNILFRDAFEISCEVDDIEEGE